MSILHILVAAVYFSVAAASIYHATKFHITPNKRSLRMAIWYAAGVAAVFSVFIFSYRDPIAMVGAFAIGFVIYAVFSLAVGWILKLLIRIFKTTSSAATNAYVRLPETTDEKHK